MVKKDIYPCTINTEEIGEYEDQTSPDEVNSKKQISTELKK